TGVTYHLHENPRSSSFNSAKPGETLKHNEEHGSFQKFSLTAQPTSLPYTPARTTPKPRTTGPQTAVVVGPAGEEIWTDEYGRIKVQFHWDRLGAMDENSSCWMRVATSWAGSGFGAISIPRIGHEVVIDFLNGDPDYPLVVGCVYNAANMPPWALPGNATQSGIKTKSSKGGAFGDGMKNGAGDANAIRFEDKKGAEQLWLHAQKDQLIEVENDEDHWVGQDRRKTIDRDETNVIHRDRTETVDRNEKITVHGWRTEEVDGDETITIHSNRKERVDHNETISIGDNRDETVGINEDIRIGKNRSKTVGRSETDSIAKNWTTTVGLLKTETIGVGCIQTTGVFKMANVGVAYNLNVGITMMTNVGMNRSDTIGMEHTHTAGKKYALTVGGGGGGAAAGAVSKNITAPSGGSGAKGGSSLVMDESSITLKVGKSVLEMKDDGTVSVNGRLIQITADGDNVVIQGEDIHLN
ncbi:type VI secretion system Vgr family protein, partial [Paracidovorax cattleyae]|uniref:type VI secretion system Vgr family protein n=1 Tax=Paracidovorax cattleyae TaxID=80868 RepID=UPI0018AF7711